MINDHLAELKKLLKQENLDAALISSLPNIIHLTGFSHFTDIEREAYLVITQKKHYIFTDARYAHAVKTNLKNFELLEISLHQPFIKLLEKIIAEENITQMGIEEDNITVAEHKKIETVIKKSKHFDLKQIRIIKHDEEITKIKNACEIGDKAFSYIFKQIKLEMTEKEIAFLLETFIKKQGAQTSFDTIVAFGPNAAVPHHKTGDKKLKKNDLILLDFGVKYENYCSDMTRTVFFGKANVEQKKVYEIVLAAQKLAIEQFSNLAIKQSKTVNAADIDKVARSYIISQGFPSIPHSLGHGIGLQVHEVPSLSPNSKSVLSEGMVFSIEPGIYLPDNLGVRIEDLFAIQNNKLIQLTKSPSSLIEL